MTIVTTDTISAVPDAETSPFPATVDVGADPVHFRQPIDADVGLSLRGRVAEGPRRGAKVTLLMRFFRQDEEGREEVPSLLGRPKLFTGYGAIRSELPGPGQDFDIELLPPPGANLVEIGFTTVDPPPSPLRLEIAELASVAPKSSGAGKSGRGTWARKVLGTKDINGQLVSVIVPVYNDAEGLRKCLTALAAQEERSAGHEVIVVDNASTEDIRSVVAEFPDMKYVHHGKPGSYSSRNFGVTHAKGTVLAFTDADCVPDPDWLRKGTHRLLKADNPRIVTGRIRLSWRNGEGPTTIAGWWERIFGFNYQRLGLAGRSFVKHGVTASMFMLRDTFDRMGGFTEDHFSGGDTDFSNRCNAAGIRVRFEGGVVLSHPAREDTRALLKKRLRIFSNLYFRELDKADRGSVFRYFYDRLKLSRQRRMERVAAAAEEYEGVPVRRLQAFVTLVMVLKILELIRLRMGGKARRA